jgi:hypothetical protein
VELREDTARSAGLAAATVAGDEPDAAQVEQVREADVELATAGGGKELVGGDRLAEGMARQGEVFAIHITNPRRVFGAVTRARGRSRCWA